MNKHGAGPLLVTMLSAFAWAQFFLWDQPWWPRRLTLSLGSSALSGLIFCILCALTGCDRPLTNQEIVQQVSYCRAHHLKPLLFTDGFHAKVVAVQCEIDL